MKIGFTLDLNCFILFAKFWCMSDIECVISCAVKWINGTVMNHGNGVNGSVMDGWQWNGWIWNEW